MVEVSKSVINLDLGPLMLKLWLQEPDIGSMYLIECLVSLDLNLKLGKTIEDKQHAISRYSLIVLFTNQNQ